MWSNKYIGLPYKTHGRDRSGLDCWGLVRLVYSEEFSILLPSLSSEYAENDYSRIEDLMAQYREGWEPTTAPKEGDVLLFRVMGTESHVGIAINEYDFLHIRDGKDSVIDSLKNPLWKKRLIGSFKYTTDTAVQLTAVPHPLKTERITVPVPAGTTIRELREWVEKTYSTELVKHNIKIVVNGIILSEKDNDLIINDGDILEYRSIPKGGDALRFVLIALVVIYAPQIAAQIASTGVAGEAAYASAMLGGGSSFAVATFSTAALTAGVMMVGMALVNAIAPIRPNNTIDPGQSERAYLSDGSQNQISKYGTIPFVLGRVRMTPPQGATAYSFFASPEENYLRALYVWGYSPLYIDSTSLRIGQTALTNYAEYTDASVGSYLDNDTWSTQATLVDRVYGNDTVQVYSGIELASESVATSTNYYYVQDAGEIAYDSYYSIGIANAGTGYRVGDVLTVVGGTGSPARLKVTRIVTGVDDFTWITRDTGQVAEVRVDYEGEYSIFKPSTSPSTTGGSGTGFVPVLTYLNRKVVSGAAGQDNTPTASEQQTVTISNTYGSLTYTDILTVSIHFPQGCRKINKKTGASSASPVKFKLEFQDTAKGTSWYPLYIPNTTDSSGFLTVGSDGPIKDAFTHTVSTSPFTRLSYSTTGSTISVRVSRYTSSENEYGDYNYYYQSQLHTVTSTINKKPVLDGNNFKFARTGLKILSTEQLNGRNEAFNGIVHTQARIYSNSIWQYPNSTTSNPAALFLHVLTHPAGQLYIKAAEESSKIDLAALGDWYNYCELKGFHYNGIVAQTRSTLEILRDIASAGRASPALINGKWTVTIDRPQSKIVQLFTPANSWGFESTKAIPKYPHGLRVTFYDESKDWQDNEVIVYANGYSETNASIFEAITLPGVTSVTEVVDHARWHLAQSKIRSEIFTLNVDLEYLVCTRGDRVKVQHDIPMWGIGAGRVTDISGLTITLDTEVPYTAGQTYDIVIRKNSTSEESRFSTLRIQSAKDSSGNNIVTSGYAKQFILLSTTGIEVNNLFAVGLINTVTQDLVVLSVEPNQNLTARLTLVDYGILDGDYSVDENGEKTIYANYLEWSATSYTYNDNITEIPLFQRDSLSGLTPIITNFISDESVATRAADGTVISNISVTHRPDTLSNVPNDLYEVFCEVKISGANTASLIKAYVTEKSVIIPNVEDLQQYQIRLKYSSKAGYFSKWSEWYTHQVVGKTTRPSTVSGVSLQVNTVSNTVAMMWDSNPEVDIAGYEVRLQDNGWGGTGYVWKGSANSTTFGLSAYNWLSTTFYIKAYDTTGNYSLIATYAIVRTESPTGVIENTIDFSYSKDSSSNTTSLTTNNINITWAEPTLIDNQLPVKEYRVFIHTQQANMLPEDVLQENIKVDTKISANSFNTYVSWSTTAYLVIEVIDIIGNKSAPAHFVLGKDNPNAVQNLQMEVVDNTITLTWEAPVVNPDTQLPIVTYKIYESQEASATFGDSSVYEIGTKTGLFTTITKIFEGSFKYWVIAIDTSNQMGATGSSTAFTKVNGPSDYQVAADIVSNLSVGTTTNTLTIIDNNISSLYLPVNTTESWSAHFNTVAIYSFEGMVTAGHPYYLTPSNSVDTASYQETFNLDSLINSGTVTVYYDYLVLYGNVNINTTVEKLNGTYESFTGTTGRLNNIQQIRITITITDAVTGNAVPDALVKFNKLRILIDSKIINDGGNLAVNGESFTNSPSGTVVTLNKAIPNINSITLTPINSGSAIIPSYTLDSSTKSASITSTNTSNYVKVTLTSGSFTGIVGARVYLGINTSATGGRSISDSNIYTVVQVDSSTIFWIDLGTPSISASITQAASIIDQFFRVFLRDTSNQLVSASEVGWNVKGYR